MKKKASLFIILTILIITLICGIIYLKHPRRQTGVNLDCARIYYRPTTLKKIINLIHKHKGTYLQLHLTDNQNFGIENKYLQQDPSHGYCHRGIWYNLHTKKPFLTLRQLKSIINYGEKINVKVYPEIDVPAHCKALYKLLVLSKHYYKKKNILAYPNKQNTNLYELDYSNPLVIKITKKIIQEYLPLLPRNDRFGLGGDEVELTNKTRPAEVISYFNQLDDFINKYNIKTIIYNDVFYNAHFIGNLKYYYNKNIIINYWSQTGSVSSSDTNENFYNNLKNRESMSQLNQLGYKTINDNSAFTYLVSRSHTNNFINNHYRENHLYRWKPNLWFGKNDQLKDNNLNNVGSSVSIWGHNGNIQHLNKKTSYKLKKFIKIYFKRCYK